MRLCRPLSDPPIALLWAGLTTSAIGDNLFSVALTWVAVGLFGATAGYLTALQAAIVLLVLLGCGHWADRRHPRSVMIAADLVRAAVLIGVMLAWLVLGRPPGWGIILVVLVLAAGEALFRPALQATVPGLITDRSLLPAANSLLDATERIARLLGRGAVVLLTGFLPLVHFLTLDAVSFIVSAMAIVLIGGLRTLPHNAPAGAESAVDAIARGFRAMRQHVLLEYALGRLFVGNSASYAVMYLGLPLMIKHWGMAGAGSGLSAYALVLTAYGCGNLLSMLMVGSLTFPPRPGLRMVIGNLTIGTGYLLVGVIMILPMPMPARLPCLIAAAVMTAIGGPMSDITIATLRQTLLPAADIAAAMRAGMVMLNLGQLLGMAAAPAVFHAIGVAPGVMLYGGVMALTGLLRLKNVTLAVV